MKKVLFILIIIFNIQLTYSQVTNPGYKDSIIGNSKKEVERYFLKYIDKKYYTKYFSLDYKNSNIRLLQSFEEIEKNSINKKSVNKIIIQLDFKSSIYSSQLEFVLNNDFEIIEHKSFNLKENYSKDLLTSYSIFIKSIEEGKILDSNKIFEYITNLYPDKKWSMPELSQNMFPPYNFHYRVLESNCKSCRSVLIDLLELKEIGKENNDMIPIKE